MRELQCALNEQVPPCDWTVPAEFWCYSFDWQASPREQEFKLMQVLSQCKVNSVHWIFVSPISQTQHSTCKLIVLCFFFFFNTAFFLCVLNFPTGFRSESKWVIQSESMQRGLTEWQGARGLSASHINRVWFKIFSVFYLTDPCYLNRHLKRKRMTRGWGNGKQITLTAAKVGLALCCEAPLRYNHCTTLWNHHLWICFFRQSRGKGS